MNKIKLFIATSLIGAVCFWIWIALSYVVNFQQFSIEWTALEALLKGLYFGAAVVGFVELVRETKLQWRKKHG